MTDTMKTIPILLLLCLSTLSFCTTKPGEPQGSGLPGLDTPVAETVSEAAPPLIETVIEKELLYDQHTLADIEHRYSVCANHLMQSQLNGRIYRFGC